MPETPLIQSILPSQIIMVRPEYFAFNEQTALTNYFQKKARGLTEQEVYDQAMREFDNTVEMYLKNDIDVIVHDTTDGNRDVSKINKAKARPDEIFPNCVVTFPGWGLPETIGRSGQKVDKNKTYAMVLPMLVENRQWERPSLVRFLKSQEYEIIDDILPNSVEYYEQNNMALEGTGAMVLDRSNKIIYSAISDRANQELAGYFTEAVGYKLKSFNTKPSYNPVTRKFEPIYHTDLVMHIGDKYHNVCSTRIVDEERDSLLEGMRVHRDVNEFTEAQAAAYCGNSQPVVNRKGDKFLSMSKRGYSSLSNEWINRFETRYNTGIIYSAIDTIEENGGGSMCCVSQEGRHIIVSSPALAA